MRIDIWHGGGDILALDPETTVHTMRLRVGLLGERIMENGGDLCDIAWTDPAEMRTHFWSRKPKSHVARVSMPLATFIKLHRQEIQGMNPFYDLGRAEFLAHWNAVHEKAEGRTT